MKKKLQHKSNQNLKKSVAQLNLVAISLGSVIAPLSRKETISRLAMVLKVPIRALVNIPEAVVLLQIHYLFECVVCPVDNYKNFNNRS